MRAPGLRIPKPSGVIMGVSAAPGRQVRAIEAGSLNQACSQQRMLKPHPIRFLPQIALNALKPWLADALLHLAKMRFGGRLALVAANPSEVPVSFQPLNQIFHVGDLLQLPQHQRPQIPLRIVPHRPAWTIYMKILPHDGADRT